MAGVTLILSHDNAKLVLELKNFKAAIEGAFKELTFGDVVMTTGLTVPIRKTKH